MLEAFSIPSTERTERIAFIFFCKICFNVIHSCSCFENDSGTVARTSAGTNARLQIAVLLLFPGCHWSIQKVMSNVKLSLFKTKTKSE